MTEPPPPLCRAVAQAATELAALQARLDRLEIGMEAALAPASAGLPPGAIALLQEVDILRQSLAAMAGFLDHLAQATDAQGRVSMGPALAAMPLRDMARRLAGGGGAGPRADAPELF